MKNNVGKVFVVLTTFLSVAFLGFAFSARIRPAESAVAEGLGSMFREAGFGKLGRFRHDRQSQFDTFFWALVYSPRIGGSRCGFSTRRFVRRTR